jgi:hypothetical protein
MAAIASGASRWAGQNHTDFARLRIACWLSASGQLSSLLLSSLFLSGIAEFMIMAFWGPA